MKTISASEFKAKCLRLMDEVASTGEPVIVTKNGKPVSRLVPYTERPKTLFGRDAGILVITGDVVSPIDVSWESEK